MTTHEDFGAYTSRSFGPEDFVELPSIDASAQEATRNNDIVTEDSAALEFIAERGSTLRYCHSTGAWFCWNGNIWSRDEKYVAFYWAREMIRKLVQDESPRIRAISSKVSFCGGVEKFAQRDPAVAVTISYWDKDPWLLGTPTGTVDLRTGTLRPARPEDGITKSTAVSPADTGCPLWLKFLTETTGGNQDLIRFLRQWLGYCLTGSIREHAFVFVYGDGGNGKGTFLNVATKIMGDYATTAAMETFTASKYDHHPTELAKLRGARIVCASETEEGRAWAEARIKALTGGDRIAARFMRQDFFEYDPHFKLLIIGNHKPTLRNIDEAMRRRLNIVPFVLKPVTIDKDLEAKLLAEGPSILQWMIQGCLDWQTNGLVRPEVVQSATAEYFSDQDTVNAWLDEYCDVRPGAEPPIWDLSSDLFGSWKKYCEQVGEDPGTQKAFAASLQRRGIEKYRVPGRGSRAFRGARLKQTAGVFGGDQE